MDTCVLCELTHISTQNVVLKNELCMFLQLDQAQEKGVQLEGAGIIIPIAHRETVFELTQDEWGATYTLLQEAKNYLDVHYQPDGYNLGWNCNEVAGQHISHAHFHVLPRYKDEKLAGKGIRYMFKSEQNSRK